jgi:integrase
VAGAVILVPKRKIFSLNRCKHCLKTREKHAKAEHGFVPDESIPRWHGWHAARRGLGSNLYALGVADKVIQDVLRHANVRTTNTYYIKTAAQQVTNAMEKLEKSLPDSLSVN